ncbi:hypothetical protein HWC09_gp012 [Lactobacillus phage 3-521]|uniref:Uncharacterized protein n=1 Tax=Lactobacillus phage 3-521 TaxID=2510943 RepID=A0A4Y5FF99_9CAUD|nr:hypothetical protein HWC09_gp012 [Lactobacillus phage 3-521]QBJ03550.1 hypothetical protein UCC3521_0012 [Lactobacillus phage 3-521]
METLKLTRKEAQLLKDKQAVEADELVYNRLGVYLTVDSTTLPIVSKVLSESKIDAFNGLVTPKITMLFFLIFVLSMFLLAEIMSTN